MIVCTVQVRGCKKFSVYLCENYLSWFYRPITFRFMMSELRYLASRTIFNDSPIAKIITGFMNVFLFGCSTVFNGEKFILF